jgi:hypothetical protein
MWVLAAVAVAGFVGWLLLAQGSKGSEPGGEALEDTVLAVPEPDETTAERSAVGSQPPAYAKDARIAELEMQLKDREFELSDQRSRVAVLEARVEELQRDAERYRGGLDQAVAELNQLRAEIERLEEAARRAPTVPTAPRSSAQVQPVGAPYVTISPLGFVLVSGFVDNPTRAAARGRLEISLIGSAGVIETRAVPMYLPPNRQERYDITFPGIFPTERIAAQAKWVE